MEKSVHWNRAITLIPYCYLLCYFAWITSNLKSFMIMSLLVIFLLFPRLFFPNSLYHVPYSSESSINWQRIFRTRNDFLFLGHCWDVPLNPFRFPRLLTDFKPRIPWECLKWLLSFRYLLGGGRQVDQFLRRWWNCGGSTPRLIIKIRKS